MLTAHATKITQWMGFNARNIGGVPGTVPLLEMDWDPVRYMRKDLPELGHRFPPIQVKVSPMKPRFEASKLKGSDPVAEESEPLNSQVQLQCTLTVPAVVTTWRPMIKRSAPAVCAPMLKLTLIVRSEQSEPIIDAIRLNARESVSPQFIDRNPVAVAVPSPLQ